MAGKAMDLFLPGVDIARVRATAMRLEHGGVGFYPSSADSFIHLDVGSVRAWPRMTRGQLLALFPDGKTCICQAVAHRCRATRKHASKSSRVALP